MSPLRLVLALGLIAIVSTNAFDCRKFSFAPACRGILLKRASAPHEFELASKTCTTPADVLLRLLEGAELAGYTDTIDVAFVRSYLNKALTETMALSAAVKQQ